MVEKRKEESWRRDYWIENARLICLVGMKTREKGKLGEKIVARHTNFILFGTLVFFLKIEGSFGLCICS